jgi:hypothetical protein
MTVQGWEVLNKYVLSILSYAYLKGRRVQFLSTRTKYEVLLLLIFLMLIFGISISGIHREYISYDLSIFLG